MKNTLGFSIIILSLSLFISCQDETKTTEPQKVEAKTETETPKARPLTSEEKFTQNSVMVRAMATPELNSFVSFSISAGLSDILSKDEGPYTLIAPSSEAFKMNNEVLKPYQHQSKKDSLARIVGSHIIKGKLDSSTMVENIRSGNGSYAITTYSGEKLVLKRKGLDIIVRDQYGNEATFGKTDITAGNGVVHVIDNVLIVD
ncbi:MAG: fasciclin domain-containing protein [Flavobacteriaceae bacterium]|nr:fasciclin domain-containing protein [Flavobacteriaceae bacterium]